MVKFCAPESVCLFGDIGRARRDPMSDARFEALNPKGSRRSSRRPPYLQSPVPNPVGLVTDFALRLRNPIAVQEIRLVSPIPLRDGEEGNNVLPSLLPFGIYDLSFLRPTFFGTCLRSFPLSLAPFAFGQSANAPRSHPYP